MAATRSDRSQAIRYDMNPPFECPMTAIRFGSMASSPWISAITLDRYATSSTLEPWKLQQASVAFQNRSPLLSFVPSGAA